MTSKNNDSKLNNKIIDVDALDTLKDIFENTNRWLQFAEAKNGALIGINGLFLFNSIDYLFEILNGNLNINIFIVGIMTTIFSLSIIIALKSFIPDKSITSCNKEYVDGDSSSDDRILIFYEHICKYESPEIYLKDIYKHYFNFNIEIKDLKRLELDYAKEIITNSKIASYKYKLFKMTLKLNFVAIIIFYAFLIIA